MGLFNFVRRRESACKEAGKESDKGATVPSRRVWVNSADRAMQVAAFNHAVGLRSRTAAMAVLRFERRLPDGRWEEFSKGSQEYRHLNWLLQVRPNSRMTACQMWTRLHLLRDLKGSGGILIERAGGRIQSLIPVSVEWNRLDDTYTATSDEFCRSWTNVPPGDIIVVRNMPVPGWPSGRSLQHYAANTLSLAATAESMCLDVVSKGGTFKAIVRQEEQMSGLQGIGRLNDNEMRQNADTLSEQFADGKDFLYDPAAATITPITQSFQDLQVDLQRSKAVEDIARFCGVPLPLMFCSTNAVYKSIDDAWHTFLVLTIVPLLTELEQAMDGTLLSEHDHGMFRFRFDTSALCLDSDKSKAETAQIYVNSGIKTPDEVRASMGLPRSKAEAAPAATPPAKTDTEDEDT